MSLKFVIFLIFSKILLLKIPLFLKLMVLPTRGVPTFLSYILSGHPQGVSLHSSISYYNFYHQ
ncbi:MAG: hypothetical protein Q8S84_02975 [bacterium]|nr:hypothetical protein [bacterium]